MKICSNEIPVAPVPIAPDSYRDRMEFWNEREVSKGIQDTMYERYETLLYERYETF